MRKCIQYYCARGLRVPASIRWAMRVFLIVLLLGAVNGEAYTQVSDGPAVYALLSQKVQTVEQVRVLVVLDVAFTPEDTLSKAPALTQRHAIMRAQDALLERLAAEQVHVNQRYTDLPGLALTVNASALSALERVPEVVSVEEDKRHKPFLDISVPLIGASDAWGMGYTGAGWAVAVLDTGVDKHHAFLSGKVLSEACYSTNYAFDKASTLCPGGGESEVGLGTGVNCAVTIAGCDHGTHVAGIAAGYQSDSLAGVAKDGNVIAIQVFSRIDDGLFCDPYPSPCITAYTSDIIAGLDRVLALHNDASFTTPIASVNLSLGGGRYTKVCDNDNVFIKLAIDKLASVGIATIVASGNDGYTDALSSPACVSSAVSVGATSDSDVVTDFSNSASFLDLLAPGASIYSSVPGGDFESWPGTSMAAPHVAGAWAVLKSANPSADITTILDAMKKTGVAITDSRNGISKPRIQVDAAADTLAGAPTIQISPQALASTQRSNVVTYTTMAVANEGTSNLLWDVSAGDPQGLAEARCHAVSDITWLSLSPNSGTIQANDAINVSVAWDSTDLVSGTYTDTLCVSSNDPDHALIRLPVSLNVISDQPPNHVPSDIFLQEAQVYEGQPAGTLVGTFRTVDADTDDLHTYTLVSGTGGTDNALFQIDGDRLETARVLDATMYSVRVRTDDSVGGTYERSFTIDILEGLSDGKLRVSPPVLSFTATLGHGDPEPQSLSISFETVGRSARPLCTADPTCDFIGIRGIDPLFPSSYPPDPPSDLEWPDSNESTVTDIQTRFNAARSNENTELGTSIPMLTMPDQVTWDGMSDGEKVLWLINRERVDRGIDPLHGLETNVGAIAQAYAQLLLDTNTTGHCQPSGNCDVDNPWNRLEANTTISACHDFLNVAENLAYLWGGWTLPIERAVYMWMYEDSGSAWGHRHAILWYPYDDNSGPTGQEGFLGVGHVSGTHQGWSDSDIIVMNVFDPCTTWVYGPTNHPPTDINLSGDSVLEGRPAGEEVGTFSTVDPDIGDTHTYRLVSGAGDAHNSAFTIDGDKLQTAEILTYATQSVYNIRVQTEDKDGEIYQKPFTITVVQADTEAWVVSHATSGGAWLSVGPDSGDGAGAVDVSVNVAGLEAGQYTGIITVTAGAEEVVVDVTLTLYEDVLVYLPLVLRN